MGRGPQYHRDEDTAKRVKAMAINATPHKVIAKIIRCTDKTLRKHYRAELDQGLIEANMLVMNSLFKNATIHNNVAAQKFWLERRAGWIETTVVENVGKDSGSIKTEVIVTSPEEGSKLYKKLAGGDVD